MQDESGTVGVPTHSKEYIIGRSVIYSMAWIQWNRVIALSAISASYLLLASQQSLSE
jgi:hypothetical protein